MQIVDTLLFAQEMPAGGILDRVKASIQTSLTPEAGLQILQSYGPPLLAAIAVFVIGKWLARIFTGMIVRASRRAKVDETLLGFMSNVVYLMLLTVVCIASLGCLGVDTTSLSAVLAAAGFAVGMALQGSLGNIASGVMLVVFKPFRAGDYVEMAGTSGKVVEIQMFNTILLTPDNIRVVVPNGNITGGTIRNFSAERRRRIDLVVGCGYNDDLLAVRNFLEDLVASDDRILTDPAPTVAVSELGESSVNLVVRPWVASNDYWSVRFDLMQAIKLGFDQRGFTIPFPSSDVFIHRSEDSSLSQAEAA